MKFTVIEKIRWPPGSHPELLLLISLLMNKDYLETVLKLKYLPNEKRY